MHIITGGAYNGKSAWVRDFYQLNNGKHFRWISAYKEEGCPDDLSVVNESLIVLEGVEQWILRWIEDHPSADHREMGRRLIQDWVNWELEDNDRMLVIIGTDISKGIVPMERNIRMWRDTTGWFYQDLVEKSNRFDLVWYGIQKQLK